MSESLALPATGSRTRAARSASTSCSTATHGAGVFEEPLNEYKSMQVTRIVHDFYDADPKRGFYGGGGLDARRCDRDADLCCADGHAARRPAWGASSSSSSRSNFTRTMVWSRAPRRCRSRRNNITLDPRVKDHLGPAGHPRDLRGPPDDLATAKFLQGRALAILRCGRREKVVDRMPVEPQNGGAHLLGTCRMGDDPATSVVDRDHRCARCAEPLHLRRQRVSSHPDAASPR